MLECMKYARSWVCAAGCLPKPVHNKARGKLQIYFPEILARGDKMDTYFSSEGRVQPVFFFLTHSISHSTRKDSTCLPWTIYFLSCIACFWQAGSDSNLSWGTKSSTASSWYHLISAVQEADRRYLILSCLLLKKMGDVHQLMVRCLHTVTTPSFRQQGLYSESAKRWLQSLLQVLPSILFTNVHCPCNHSYLREVSLPGCFKLQYDVWGSLKAVPTTLHLHNPRWVPFLFLSG